MKTFKKTYLPEEIKYNGETYKFNGDISAAMKLSRTNPQKTIEAVKSTGKKAVLVEVMNPKLKGIKDLRGNNYTPSQFIFTN